MNLLRDTIKRHFNANYTSSTETLLRELESPTFPNRKQEFREQLAEAIKNSLISNSELEKLTDDEYENQEEVNEFLINEIWKPLYGNEPIEV
ncbi:MAG: hypothetical protein ABIP06_15330 [Pyrinomonadaceae bacterium]